MRIMLLTYAKYKPFTNISGDDYLQILAYMYRFDSKRAYYFYPETNDVGGKVLYINSGSSYEHNVKAKENVQIIKHGLLIPNDASSYDEFVMRIQKNEAVYLPE